MGLDTTHGAWNGAYSAFHRWRCKLAEVAGFPPLEMMAGFMRDGGPGFVSSVKLVRDELERRGGSEMSMGILNELLAIKPIAWESLADDPLTGLLMHSDCDGEIAHEDCGPLADRLEGLLPKLPEGDAGGHIGVWREKTKAFIDGLRLAAERNESVEFH